MPLTITVPSVELFDSETSMFKELPAVELELEHSLVSLSKWEASFGKPFLGPGEKTNEEIYGYIHAMCLTPKTPMSVVERACSDPDIFEQINKHIDAKMTATWITERPGQKVSREIVTAELIYHWMFSLNVPKELETWHLNRLITQIKVINEKNAPPKKMSKAETLQRHREINARNRAAMQNGGNR